MKHLNWLVVAILALFASTACAARQPQVHIIRAEDQFVGTWEFVDFVIYTVDDSFYLRMKVVGELNFGPDGRASGQVKFIRYEMVSHGQDQFIPLEGLTYSVDVENKTLNVFDADKNNQRVMTWGYSFKDDGLELDDSFLEIMGPMGQSNEDKRTFESYRVKLVLKRK